MEIDRKELKRQARERMALTDPKFWVVALAYIAMTTGVSWIISLLPLPDDSLPQIFFQMLLTLYTTVVQFGLCLWALWTYRQLDPGVGSLMQGFSVAGRVLLMEIGIYIRTLGWYLLVATGLTIPMVILMMTVDSYVGVLMAFFPYVIALFVVIYIISLRYALAPYLLADRPDDGPSIPIYRSVQLMRGWKWELFKLKFSFIGWELINLVLSAGVILFFLSRSGLLSIELLQDAEWSQRCIAVVYSAPSVILSTLITVPLSLWLTPYQEVAKAGFYDARLLAAQRETGPVEMPPL